MRKIQEQWKRYIANIKTLTFHDVSFWCIEKLKHTQSKQYARALIVFIVIFTILFAEINPHQLLMGSYQFYTGEIIYQEYLISEGTFYEYPETVQTNVSQQQGPSFLYSQANEGEIGVTYQDYILTYDMFGHLLTRQASSDITFQQAQDIEYSPGSKVKTGAYFYPKYSRYGVDCVGCTGRKTGKGNFANGVHYEKDKGVRQFDGTYSGDIKYEGYYIIAADPSIPFCTVLEITNHRFQGAGIVNNQPFQVVVLDRGSAIKGNRIDLFVGLESDMQVGYGKWQTSKKTTATVVKRGKWTKNSLGQRGCKF
ncbi:MAG: 3D domain-containing protein [Erysipelotrichaceae bacterium]|nr:3D domain-containing protein [Erysipelotrichaceae bacterium]